MAKATESIINMTLQDAEKIVQEFSSALTSESLTDGPASFASALPNSPEKIVQAMKLRLANDIKNRSLAKNFCDEIKTVASRLPFFIADEEARRLNTTSRRFSRQERGNLSTEEFLARVKADQEVHEWALNASIAGSSLRGELSDFIAAVEHFDPADLLFWQRVYTLVGLEYVAPKKRSFWNWFSCFF